MLLDINNLCTYYGKLQALFGVSLKADAGEIVALIGSNGAGKSTLLKSVAGSMRKTEGSIRFCDRSITGLHASAIVRMGAVLCPEGRQIFPRLTVQENLRIGGYTAERATIEAGFENVYDLFPILKERSKQFAGTLSGGEQQMLAIGRALMVKPKLMMLDEPSLGLSPLLTEKIFDLLLTIRDQGITILLVEQNAVMALSIANRGYVIKNGRIVLEGTGAELLNSDEVVKNYLCG